MGEVIAVACVVESSLALAAEWTQVQVEYIVPLLQRLGEAHTPPTFRIAFVSYGTVDTMPTPVLAKLFFSPPANMMKDMREEPHKLGIGQTGSGGGYGMAALEGLVAAIELFDTLRASVETAMTCHLIHFASTPPDPAERPLWNVSTALDSVTWNTLPSELKKRGIHYSNVLLKQIARFTQVQAAAAAGPVQSPWFSVRSPHVLHLTGFPQKGTKRPGSVDRSPEITKRAKVQSSPLKSPATITSMPTSSPPQLPPPSTMKTPSMAPAIPPVPAEPTAQAATVAPPPTFSVQAQQAALERLHKADEMLRANVVSIQNMENEGRMEEAKKARAELLLKVEKYKQFKALIAHSMSSTMASTSTGLPARAPAAPPAPGEAPRPQTATDLAAQLDQNRTAVPNPNATQTASTSAPNPPLLPTAASNPPGQLQIPPNYPPEVVAQMQKLIDQKSRPTHLGAQPQPPQPQPPALQLSAQPQVQSQPQPPPQNQPPPSQLSQLQGQPQSQPSASAPEGPSVPGVPAVARPPHMWVGTLSWSGFDAETHVKKDVHAAVMIHGHNAELMRPDTWPSILSLAPSQHRAVPVQILQGWLARQKCVPLAVLQNTQAPDPKKNEEHFRSLLRLLTDKNVYALASWNGPIGVPENRILFFILGGKLAGAYFYLPGGMPELPKPEIGGIPLSGIPLSLAKILANMSPPDQAIFSALPNDQKKEWLKNLVERTRRQAQAQQAQQAQSGQPGRPPLQPPQPGIPAQPQQQQLQQPMQQAGPSQQQPPLRNPIQNIRQGEFNPWLQGSGPNVAAILTGGVSGNPNAPAAPNAQQQAAQQQNAMSQLGMPFGGLGQLQMQPGAQGQGMGMGMGTNMGMGMGMGVPGMNMGMGMGMNMNMGGQGMHRRTPSAGSQAGLGQANLSYDVLQSFIQRNQEGGAGPGAGPNPGMGGM
ncbi:hypothetical protein C8Q70DRAFT_337759 [Cubamyces menziesii]|nr:hypothetical protein C8Q70DRAFT_337759 [Cubamyces menziesii]